MEQYKDHRSPTKFAAHHPEISGELVDSLQESSKQDIAQLQHIYTALLAKVSTQDDQSVATSTENVYILIKYQGKDTCIKVGTREEIDPSSLQKSPIPLLISDQTSQDKQRWLRIDKNDTHIHIRNYADAVALWRDALLHQAFSNGAYQEAIKDIKKLQRLDNQQFYKQIWKGRKFYSPERARLIQCVSQMGISQTQLQTGDEETYDQLYELIQTFDTKRQRFTPQYVSNSE